MRHFRAWCGALMLLVSVAGVWFRIIVLPRRPENSRRGWPRRIPDGDPRPTTDGKGLRLVVNPAAGPALLPAPTEALREALPAADVRELDKADDLIKLLSDPRFGSIGAAGGDGTLAAAAAIAVARDATFVAVPGGTLNHLARDLGLDTVDDAVDAVRHGYALSMDVGTVGDRVFVNTLSFGGYAPVVDTRERLERWIGKWPALVVALVWQLPRMRPLHLEIDGRRMRVWLGWVGNGAYSPTGLGPLWREQLDDGLLDIRLVHGERRCSRTRFAAAVLTGRLARCHVYSEWTAKTLDVVCVDGPQRIAADGETFDGPARFTVAKKPNALRVAVPPPRG
ncbi:MAG TPA: diacylglycerol kinase family protein [Acidimicrobiales bacterium]|nr:diacylglycerol kinase family protein [Acidimicrobiales bacterium]